MNNRVYLEGGKVWYEIAVQIKNSDRGFKEEIQSIFLFKYKEYFNFRCNEINISESAR